VAGHRAEAVAELIHRRGLWRTVEQLEHASASLGFVGMNLLSTAIQEPAWAHSLRVMHDPPGAATV
jgi:hypothetical protein